MAYIYNKILQQKIVFDTLVLECSLDTYGLTKKSLQIQRTLLER